MKQTETNRLAQQLHDGIAQDLVGFGYALDLIISNSSTTIATRSEIRKIRLDVSELLERTRLEIHDLHQIDDSELLLQIQNSVTDICEGHEVEIDAPSISIKLSAESTYQILKIVREALRNIVRHARATHIWISIVADDNFLQVSVRDNGTKIGDESPDSFGLIGAVKRAEGLHGSIEFGPTADGFELHLTIPLPIRVA